MSLHNVKPIEVGMVFGYRTITKEIASSGSGEYEAICVCGKVQMLNKRQIREGKSCGCQKGKIPRDEEYEGKTFGAFRVIKLYRVSKRRKTWLCECSCGKTEIVLTSFLRRPGDRKCPHEIREVKKTPYEVLRRGYKKDAVSRKFEWALEYEEFLGIIKENCFYCGVEPRQKIRKTNMLFNGIDRVDNKKGYIKGNVVACCGVCNKMKLSMRLEDFILKIKRIYEHITDRCKQMTNNT